MSSTDVTLTAGQLNDLPSQEEPFEYKAPIDFVTTVYIYYGKIKNINDVTAFIDRHPHFEDIIKKKIAYLIDTGAVTINNNEDFVIDLNKEWDDSENPDLAFNTVPDLMACLCQRSFLDRQKKPYDQNNYGLVLTFSETKSTRDKILQAKEAFRKRLKEISKEDEVNASTGTEVRSVFFGSGLVKEEDFS